MRDSDAHLFKSKRRRLSGSIENDLNTYDLSSEKTEIRYNSALSLKGDLAKTFR